MNSADVHVDLYYPAATAAALAAVVVCSLFRAACFLIIKYYVSNFLLGAASTCSSDISSVKTVELANALMEFCPA